MSTVNNWSRVHRFRPYARHWPASDDECAAIVRTAASRGERVKAIGAGHSWSDNMCTDGHLISLDRMNRLLDVDGTRVTVEAGIRLRQLNDQLAAHGLAMPVLGSISEQSVAGAIATGTHGSGVGFGNLSAAVVGLRLITASGEIVDVTDDDPELLSAARLHLGCLGLVTRVTLQVEPAFRLRERILNVRFDEALARMEELITSGEHVKLWWLPHTEVVRVSILDRTDEPASRPGPLVRGVERLLSRGRRESMDLTVAADRMLNDHVFRTLLEMTSQRPELTPAVNRLLAGTLAKPMVRVGRSDRIFNLAMPPIHRETEYGIPRDRAAEGLVGLRRLIEDRDLFVNFIVEVRFVAADDIMLSGAYGRDSCQLGAYICDTPSLPAYFAGFEEMCLEMGGRPHWGKEFAAGPGALRQVFPAIGSFNAIRRRLDPDGVFENAFARRVFGA